MAFEFADHPYLQERLEFSLGAITRLRQSVSEQIAERVSPAALSVVVVGSYGRCEVSGVSDVDFFILHDGSVSEATLTHVLHRVNAVLRAVSQPGESDRSKFSAAALVRDSHLSANIAGRCESREMLTQRMLMLLESRPLFGDACWVQARQSVLRQYVPCHQGEGLARFMLNDLVRYYRTMMSSFEEKMLDGKAWGVRNIKLRFSRKLLFLGGIMLIAQSWGLPGAEKRRCIERLLRLTPLQRLADLGAFNPHTALLLSQYSAFLRIISSAENRRLLDQLQPSTAHHAPLYRALKHLGKSFSQSLDSWLDAQYPNHPIHSALRF